MVEKVFKYAKNGKTLENFMIGLCLMDTKKD